MGQKVVGGMWCDYCQRPVAGQKPTSRARNTIVGLTAPLTSGLSLLGAKFNRVYCPSCGQEVRPATPQDFGATAPRSKPDPSSGQPASERTVRRMEAKADRDKKRGAKSTRLYCAEPGCNKRVTRELRARHCEQHRPPA